MEQRYVVLAATFRNFQQGQQPTDIPTIIRLDTNTGQAWFLEGIQGQGVVWVGVKEAGPAPVHE